MKSKYKIKQEGIFEIAILIDGDITGHLEKLFNFSGGDTEQTIRLLLAKIAEWVWRFVIGGEALDIERIENELIREGLFPTDGTMKIYEYFYNREAVHEYKITKIELRSDNND